MEEELIHFETAKLAKEKGFNIKNYINIDNENPKNLNSNYNPKVYQPWYLEITQALLQKWLREEYCIDVIVTISVSDKKYYRCSINESEPLRRPNQYFIEYDSKTINIYNNYEGALEAGLYEALKLI